MCLLSVASLASIGAKPVLAVSAPAYTLSWYVTNFDTAVAYSHGCSVGQAALNGTLPQSVMVILDFFSQDDNGNGNLGTTRGDGVFHPISQARAVATEWAHGFWVCTASDSTARLTLAMGTRNYLYVGGSVSVNLYEYQAMGTAWAQMVVATNTGLGTYGSQTKIVGATDSELDWNTPDLTLAWGTAYSNANGFPYYDFGDAALGLMEAPSLGG